MNLSADAVGDFPGVSTSRRTRTAYLKTDQHPLFPAEQPDGSMHLGDQQISTTTIICRSTYSTNIRTVQITVSIWFSFYFHSVCDITLSLANWPLMAPKANPFLLLILLHLYILLNLRNPKSQRLAVCSGITCSGHRGFARCVPTR